MENQAQPPTEASQSPQLFPAVQTAAQTPPPPQQPPKKKKLPIFAILLVLVLISVAVFGFFYANTYLTINAQLDKIMKRNVSPTSFIPSKSEGPISQTTPTSGP